MNPGLIGGLIGSAVGLLGGIVGTYFSIHNTRGPRERGFVIRASIATWVVLGAFLAALFLIPSPWCHLMWIPYGILLPIGIIKWNRTQARIRQEESGQEA